MSLLVTVIGATGAVGGQVADLLLKNGVKIRAISRHTEKLAALAARGAEPRIGDLEDPAFLADAFRGTDASFVMIPSYLSDPDSPARRRRDADAITQALQSAEAKHAVALSSIAAGLPSGTGPIADLHHFEEKLHAVPGLSVVALRCAFFMENHLASLPLLKNAGINGGVMRGDVPLPMVATRDIAAVAAGYLSHPAFSGNAVHDLLGPRDYTFREATAIIGKAIGKPELPYVEFPPEEVRKNLLAAGFSPATADAFLELMQANNEGRIQGTVQRNAENTTPTTFETFVEEVMAPAYLAG